MRILVFLFLTLGLAAGPSAAVAQKGAFGEVKQLQSPQDPTIGFMIQAGTNVIAKGAMTPEKEKEIRAKLEEIVLAGFKALKDGKSSVEAVELAVKMLEDSPLFVPDGKNELDASIMDGKTLNAGSVASVHRVRNPITLARAVMEKTSNVMLAGDGAEKFAREQKIEFVDEAAKGDRPKPAADPAAVNGKSVSVGAVALDRKGNIAAGSSSGGISNGRPGRVSEAAVIGAGTYARNDTCGVSGSGWGEYFLRLGVARDMSSVMEYQALPIQTAADRVIKQKLQRAGGSGGIIAIDKLGNMAMSFNTDGMYRAYINSEGKAVVEIY